MQDAWRAYLEMALGLTEAPRKRAQKVVGDLLSRGGATAAQLQGLAEDLMNTGMANREALTNIVRYEVDRALGVVGLATADEVSDLTSRVHDLENQLKEAQDRAAAAEAAKLDPGVAGAGTGGRRLNQPAPLPAKAAKKAVAKKAVAKTAVRPNAMPAAATATPAPAKSAPAPAKSAPAAVKSAPAAVKSAPAAAKSALAAAKSAPAPEDTAEAPVAAVRDAAAATTLPASTGVGGATTEPPTAAKKAAKKAAAATSAPGAAVAEAAAAAPRKAAPAKKAATAARTAPAKKTSPRKAPSPGNPSLEA